MATGNFYNVNASKIFALLNNDDDYIIMDTINNLECDLIENFNYYKTNEVFRRQNRNYLSDEIATKSIDFFDDKNNKLICEVDIQAILVNGYYYGVNLDYDLYISLYGDNYLQINLTSLKELEDAYDVDFIVDSVESYDIVDGEETFNNNKNKLLFDKFVNNVKRVIQKELDTLEQIYRDYSDELEVFARFSNGETIYINA